MSREPERGEFFVHPLIVGRRCADCGEYLGKEEEWFTCSICGKKICERCRRGHISTCMVETWGLAKVDPDTGELVQEEKPPRFAMG